MFVLAELRDVSHPGRISASVSNVISMIGGLMTKVWIIASVLVGLALSTGTAQAGPPRDCQGPYGCGTKPVDLTPKKPISDACANPATRGCRNNQPPGGGGGNSGGWDLVCWPGTSFCTPYFY